MWSRGGLAHIGLEIYGCCRAGRLGLSWTLVLWMGVRGEGGGGGKGGWRRGMGMVGGGFCWGWFLCGGWRVRV